MDSTKPRDKLTDQELLDLLKDDNEEVNLSLVDEEQNVFGFISAYKLKSGNDKINIAVLYNLYNIWAKEPILKNNLKNQLKDLFRLDADDNIYLELKESEISQMMIQVLSKRNKTEKQAKHIHKNISSFLRKETITAGPHYVQDYVLYAIYSRHFTNRMRFSTTTFISGLKNILEYKIDVNNVYWFGINTKTLNVSQEEIETARKLSEKEKTNKKI